MRGGVLKKHGHTRTHTDGHGAGTAEGLETLRSPEWRGQETTPQRGAKGLEEGMPSWRSAIPGAGLPKGRVVGRGIES